MNALRKMLYGAALVLGLAGAPGAAWAEPAGQVLYVNGAAHLITPAGTARPLHKGDAVNEGDSLVTGANAAVQVRMRDGGMVAVRPDTRMRFDSFKFDGQADGTEQSFVSLLKGGFRAITGLIGRLHKSSYRITTPTATVGIRGTDHETIVVVPGSPLAATVPPGTYNKVNRGETVVTNAQGSVFVLPNQMAYAPAGKAPELQPLNLDLFVVPPPPLSRSGTEGGVRVAAVVDAALLAPDFSMGPNLPLGVLFARIPITAIYNPPPILCQIAPCSPTPITF